MSLTALLRVFWVVAGLFVFVLALQTTRAGAADADRLFDALNATGFANSLGLGWLFTYIVLSGSPVAAVAVSLYSEGTLTQQESYAMVAGSRFGASFITLAVGVIYYLAGRRGPDGLAIGVVAMLTTFVTQVPALAIGSAAIRNGWLDGVSASPPSFLLDFVDNTFGPLVDILDSFLPNAGLFVVGVFLILGSFWLFDRSLPSIDEEAAAVQRLLGVLRRRLLMLVMGIVVTLTTLSVAISVTVLVPLALKGYLKREHVIPYILGANIATYIDTLGAAFLVGGGGALAIVIAQAGSLAIVSVLALTIAYRPLTATVVHASTWATASPTRLATFLLALVAVPALLVAL